MQSGHTGLELVARRSGDLQKNPPAQVILNRPASLTAGTPRVQETLKLLEKQSPWSWFIYSI